MAAQKTPLDEPVIGGPFSLFEGSFILEFLQPHPSRDASVLMRATYKHDHPLCEKGAGHPQGQVSTVKGWSATKRAWTRGDGGHEIKRWVPHSFQPVPDSPEDTIILVWAHPGDVDEMMDRVFFKNLLLMYVSDVHEKKVTLNPFQIMLLQHVSATALVWFPTARWLGPLRWWVPWKVQAIFAGTHTYDEEVYF
ncbi:hypothetical protein EYB25_009255 [Talaromyces marneffei]|uniref:uncharacterized protein n=1 Tax=Talaromyces marneffei TaxID=37727 RepID=UPI0012A8030E|nr:uncharacterized protein EYB26_009930 [Talaromyces marneffei]KAE8548872.1 hypothetical protein EYB25_009255 [Talaromyces marneffei]QGA22214.1 hypothetical protein EYB26_009930 [Talaromyces marneffei]